MKIIFFLFTLSISTSHLFGQEIFYPEKSDKISTLELLIENIPSEKGEIRIVVFNSEQEYNAKENPLEAIVLPVKEESLKWNTALPSGNYAIAVYHDKNENGELDLNFFGKPKEAYGFSNNAKGKFGPASWKEAGFELSGNTSQMVIRLN